VQASSRRTLPRRSRPSARYSPNSIDWGLPTPFWRHRRPQSCPAGSRRHSKGRHRFLVAHPVNPPHLVPLVELVGAPWTAADTISRAKTFYESVGQVPIVVRREIDGFILNRLQAVLLSEAFSLAGEGYVTHRRISTRRLRTGSACAGRSWVLSKRSNSTRRLVFLIIASAMVRVSAD
jgi:3-hydroxyacyl-CoA dehydrogenase, NAD binding domain